MPPFVRRVLFLLFFLSGFCGLLYQVVWTRMAFAAFGIITPVLSVVISMFMLGLSLGSWGGGRWIGRLVRKTAFSAVVFYAFAELMIGLGAFAVPRLFALSEQFLLAAGQSDSLTYLSLSAVSLALSILPWCIFMGTTFPLMMAFVREHDAQNNQSFSFLYLANVMGAMAGTSLTAVVFVEALGFRHTLWVAAACNVSIAIIACWLGTRRTDAVPGRIVPGASDVGAEPIVSAAAIAKDSGPRFINWILFSTGFVAMAMEVVWTRAFTPVLKTQVYSFALVVFAYLGATFVGSVLYRRDLGRKVARPTAQLLAFLAMAAFLPIIINDPRFVRASGTSAPHPLSLIAVLLSICPLCGVLGYLTPSLVDQYSGGSPQRAGKAYAINVLGCILGPLLACYLLLPRMSERQALIGLAIPLLAFYFACAKGLVGKQRLVSGLAVVGVFTCSLFYSGTYEDYMRLTQKNTVVRRDYAASVLSYGEKLDKRLLVNGIGMTHLTPITKFMVHLPLALHQGPPQSALIICFGMGTSYRSALSWDIPTTAVELVPSVKDAFGFYHADADRVITHPKGHIIVDDGRRFLKRTREKFDVIVVDPPPPPGAAGSSLLYSEEFYQLAKEHLNSGGILQAWFPGADDTTVQAVLRSIAESFPYVRRFDSLERWGMHLLASNDPIPMSDPAELVARIPAAARSDLLEWSASQEIIPYVARVLTQEISIRDTLNPDPRIRITDDQPYNEYFLLRRWGIISAGHTAPGESSRVNTAAK